eukprot:GHVN01085054.1.p1 GENE.GHVN01085054.1~~GHVN01085054.1.p1  ORF type:complete len:572 (+),score=116.96 GHVN01085054.1:140-1855(+)
MAAVHDRAPSIASQKTRALAGQSIWKEILEGATKTAEFSDSHLLVLGRKDVGKSSIIRALQLVAAPNLEQMEEYGNVDAVSALDFAFLNVRNVDDEDHSQTLATCNLWIVQHASHKPLLMEKLEPEFLSKMCVLIFLDMSQPWTIREDLVYWLTFVSDVVSDLSGELEEEEYQNLKAKMSNYIAQYKHKVSEEEEGQESPPPSLITINFGVPIVICVAKSDTYRRLDTRTSQGHIDVIGAHLRHCCLPYGGALVYANAKEPKNTRNIELLYRYILHRVYNFEFTEEPDLESGDGLFMPAGWDTAQEIQAFAATTVAEGLEKPFESIITKPTLETHHSEMDNRPTEDMNSFLANALAANPSSAGVRPERLRAYGDEPKEKSEAKVEKSSRDKDREKHDEKDRSKRDDKERSSKDRERRGERGEGGHSTSRGDKEKGDKDKPLKNYFQSLLTKREGEGNGTEGRERETKSSRRDKDESERDRDKDRDRDRDRERSSKREGKTEKKVEEKEKERKERKEESSGKSGEKSKKSDKSKVPPKPPSPPSGDAPPESPRKHLSTHSPLTPLQLPLVEG